MLSVSDIMTKSLLPYKDLSCHICEREKHLGKRKKLSSSSCSAGDFEKIFDTNFEFAFAWSFCYCVRMWFSLHHNVIVGMVIIDIML